MSHPSASAPGAAVISLTAITPWVPGQYLGSERHRQSIQLLAEMGFSCHGN